MPEPDPKALPLPPGLPAGALRQVCDPGLFSFASTDEIEPLETLFGQKRAMDAIQLSAQISCHDFNIYVMGREGSGRHRTVENILSGESRKHPVPDDWVYVNNFESPHRPKALRLPPGSAPGFRRAMQQLVDDLAIEIPALFESEEYQTQKRSLEQEYGDRHETAMSDFADRAKTENVAVLRTPMGYMLAAIIDGQVVKPEIYDTLDEESRTEIGQKIERLEHDLAEVLKMAPVLEREHRERLGQLHADMAERAVSSRVNDAADALPNDTGLRDYLKAVRADIIANAELFLDTAPDDGGPFPEEIIKYHREPQFDRYAVNVMVTHANGPGSGAPVVCEDVPSLAHLTGRIEHVSQMGTLVTNFTLIKPGALHIANGGYIVLDARHILTEPFAWDALKRCLQKRAVTITSMAERPSLSSTMSLEPDPIPLDLRVVLIGDRRLYALLAMLDPEFRLLFKVQADFDDQLPRTKKNLQLFARLIAGYAQGQGLRPLTAGAVARLLDEASRLADDTKKLSLHLGSLDDLTREADHYAAQARRSRINADDIEKAVREAEHRAARIRELMQEAVTRKSILIDTAGTAVGQINGLSVTGFGSARFGRPSRITARVRMGAGKLVDIEREVELGGPLHSKGVLILSGFLATTYALDVPMSLHASIVFEQSYGGIDGDSASSAELYALMSALSGIPIRQGLAVTGSVNQAGQIQAIGGVNEKIEGFFDLCKARRLTGHQGVLIPEANSDHLMLRQDVVEAVRDGKFRVIPVATVEAGIEILTGQRAGKRNRSGSFPDGTVNALIEARLRQYAQARRNFAAQEPKSGNGAAS